MKVYIMFTIDVESTHHPINDFYLFEGALRIAEILKYNGIRGVFFCDYFEIYKHGDKVKEVIKKLSLDHDVELHAHPGHKVGKYCCMADFSFEKQFEYIKEGITIFKELGITPRAYRAGAYSIDKNTLKALEANSIFIDSSVFPFDKRSKIKTIPNKIIKFGPILELPINIFKREIVLKTPFGDLTSSLFSSFLSFIHKNYSKVDLDWCSLEELLWFIENANEYDINFVNIFMHSYSLTKFDSDFKKIGEKNINKLNSLLKFIHNNKNIEVVSIKTIDKIGLVNRYNTIKIPVFRKHVTISTLIKKYLLPRILP